MSKQHSRNVVRVEYITVFPTNCTLFHKNMHVNEKGLITGFDKFSEYFETGIVINTF